jgi:isopenicillin N synthase-like dioxygenase
MLATPIEGVMYMNIGDMFQRISNGKLSKLWSSRSLLRNFLGFYPSALHCVAIFDKTIGEAMPPRYSILYFVSPLPDGIIKPQPSLVAIYGKRVYEPVTFESYSEEMFKISRELEKEE